MALQGQPLEQLGAPRHCDVMAPIPIELILLPPGSYSVTCEMSDHKIEDEPPAGWGQSREHVYQQIADKMLAHGFKRDAHSPSVWHTEDDAIGAYLAMLSLKNIRLPGIFETCVHRVEMRAFRKVFIDFDHESIMRW